MTYEYACTACGHAWEAEQSISAAPLRECPSCKQATAKRQVSGGAGFILKGGGWYADLYSSSNGSKKSDSGDGSTSATKTETKTETKKPEASSTTTTASSTSGSSTGAASS